MLQRVYIDNYRCFVNFECRLASKQLIIGANGSGKSTFMSALGALGGFCILGAPAELFLGSTRTRWQDVPKQIFELDVAGNGGSYAFKLIVDSSGQPARVRVVSEEVHFNGKPVFRFLNGEVNLFNDRHELKVKYPFDPHRSALATIVDRPENTVLMWFKRWLSRLWLISPDPRRMEAITAKEDSGPRVDLSNYANWYRHLRQEEDVQALQAELREVIPGFLSMDLKDAGMGNRVLGLTYPVQNGVPQFYTFNELSDGQRVLVGLYTLLHFSIRQGFTICFDEPDNYLALAEIQPWLNKLLDQVDEFDAQVLIASHHPELINRMALEDGVILDRPEGRHSRVVPFADSASTGLAPAELVARGWENG